MKTPIMQGFIPFYSHPDAILRKIIYLQKARFLCYILIRVPVFKCSLNGLAIRLVGDLGYSQ